MQAVQVEGLPHDRSKTSLRWISIVAQGACFLTICYFLTVYFYGHVNNFTDAIEINTSLMKSLYDREEYENWESEILKSKLIRYYVKCIEFVKKHTEENSLILVPPQRLPWGAIGNVGLTRYFLYPRKLENGSIDTSDKTLLENVDFKPKYILFSNHDSLLWPQVGFELWPQTRIKAKRVLLFSPRRKRPVVVEGDYDPSQIDNTKRAFGIIELPD